MARQIQDGNNALEAGAMQTKVAVSKHFLYAGDILAVLNFNFNVSEPHNAQAERMAEAILSSHRLASFAPLDSVEEIRTQLEPTDTTNCATHKNGCA